MSYLVVHFFVAIPSWFVGEDTNKGGQSMPETELF